MVLTDPAARQRQHYKLIDRLPRLRIPTPSASKIGAVQPKWSKVVRSRQNQFPTGLQNACQFTDRESWIRNVLDCLATDYRIKLVSQKRKPLNVCPFPANISDP